MQIIVMNTSHQVSIIVPTFREVSNIQPLVERISRVDFMGEEMELIIVDDNSQDGIAQLMQTLSLEYPWVKFIERRKNRSLSWSVLEGCAAANYPVLVVMDADLSHPPEKIPDMMALLAQPSIDFVIGSRYIKNGSMDEKWPIRRRVTSKFAALAAQVVLSAKVKDPLSGFLCFRKSTLLSADSLNPIGWKIGLELMVKCRSQQIREVPIHFSERFRGKSKLTIKVVVEYMRHIFALIWYKSGLSK